MRPLERGRSSGVEHNLAKVRAEGSNPFARSKKINDLDILFKSLIITAVAMAV